MMESRSIDSRLVALGIALVAALVYANSLGNDFAFDDWWIIYNNPRLHQLGDLGEIVLTPYWPQYGAKLGLYRPLTVLFFAVEWVVSGGNAWLFHFFNVVMHAAVSVLVWRLLRHYASNTAAIAGALLFAVHPLHTEAVANIVGQAELWAGLSVVGASVVFLGRRGDEPLSLARLLAIAALYAMGLAAKEHSIVLPGILVALELARRPMPVRDYFRRHAGWIVPALALLVTVAVAYLAIRISVLGSLTGQNAGPQFPFLREEHRVFSAMRAWPEYMRLLFYPVDLSADYSPSVILPVEGQMTPMMVLGGLILAGVVLLAALTPWAPKAGLPAAWFFICILPVSNLLFPIGVLLAERILYLPSVAIGFFVAFAWDGVAVARPRFRGLELHRIGAALLAVVVVWFGALTWARNPAWETSFTVIESVIDDHPESYRAQWNAGSLAFMDADTARAQYHYEMAVRMWDRDSNMLTDVGSFYLSLGNYERARVLLRRAFEEHPDLIRTMAVLAVAELGTGRPEAALQVAEHGIAYYPTHPTFFDLRARALLAMGRPLEAAGSWRTWDRLGGTGWVQWAQLARALGEVDSTAGALAALDTAIVQARAIGDTATARGLETARPGLLLENSGSPR